MVNFNSQIIGMDLRKEIREISVCPNSKEDNDYLKLGRDIKSSETIFKLHNKIFNEFIRINLNEQQFKIEIINCEFKNGLSISWASTTTPHDYCFSIYHSEIKDGLTLASFELTKTVQIDFTEIGKLLFIGKSESISLYGCEIYQLFMKDEQCEKLLIEKTKIRHYALKKIDIKEVDIDTKELAIKDYNRFISQEEQTVADVSEIYHRLVLRIPKSIGETRKINYEIAKATSSKYLILFGYFFNPLYVFYWMLVIIAVFSLLYCFLLNQTIENSIYSSIYTFLTIGFSDIADNSHVLVKSILVFLEGFLGITYCAVFLTSIINSSKK